MNVIVMPNGANELPYSKKYIFEGRNIQSFVLIHGTFPIVKKGRYDFEALKKNFRLLVSGNPFTF